MLLVESKLANNLLHDDSASEWLLFNTVHVVAGRGQSIKEILRVAITVR